MNMQMTEDGQIIVTGPTVEAHTLRPVCQAYGYQGPSGWRLFLHKLKGGFFMFTHLLCRGGKAPTKVKGDPLDDIADCLRYGARIRIRLKERPMPLDLDIMFRYHAPKGDQPARAFAQVIVDNTPESADQTAAIRKLSEAVMTANAAIAREP